MAVVTIDGQIGGPRQIGPNIARLLGVDYVDRLILAEAARRLSATIEVLAEREERVPRLIERIGRLLERAMERSAMVGVGGDPYLGRGLGSIYDEVSRVPATRAQEVEDGRFIEVTKEVIRELAQAGNVVIIGRGGCIIVKDMPQVLRVGIVADDMEDRIAYIMERDTLERAAAEKYTNDTEKARIAYFRKFFKVHPDDPQLYHMMVNISAMNSEYAAVVIAEAARALEAKTAG